jgi:hypothetical protein
MFKQYWFEGYQINLPGVPTFLRLALVIEYLMSNVSRLYDGPFFTVILSQSVGHQFPSDTTQYLTRLQLYHYVCLKSLNFFLSNIKEVSFST